MPLTPAITQIHELKDRPAVAILLAQAPAALEAARFDRNELTLYIAKSHLLSVATLLRDQEDLRFTFLADVTCVDWQPNEPRFEVVYELLSMARKERLRLKVRLEAADAKVGSVTGIWPAANAFEREVFDLFGIHFEGHPDLRRIMMPDDWQGHPLRKDYPVEGYR